MLNIPTGPIGADRWMEKFVNDMESAMRDLPFEEAMAIMAECVQGTASSPYPMEVGQMMGNASTPVLKKELQKHRALRRELAELREACTHNCARLMEEQQTMHVLMAEREELLKQLGPLVDVVTLVDTETIEVPAQLRTAMELAHPIQVADQPLWEDDASMTTSRPDSASLEQDFQSGPSRDGGGRRRRHGGGPSRRRRTAARRHREGEVVSELVLGQAGFSSSAGASALSSATVADVRAMVMQFPVAARAA